MLLQRGAARFLHLQILGVKNTFGLKIKVVFKVAMLLRTIVLLLGRCSLADHILCKCASPALMRITSRSTGRSPINNFLDARYTNASSIITSTSSSSTLSSSSAYTGPCSPACGAAQDSTAFQWVKQAVTSTILAAKVIIIFNKATNTTRTETSYYPLPDGKTLPPTNAAGAHITTIFVSTAAGQPKQEIVL